jgi:hypothetical protein
MYNASGEQYRIQRQIGNTLMWRWWIVDTETDEPIAACQNKTDVQQIAGLLNGLTPTKGDMNK